MKTGVMDMTKLYIYATDLRTYMQGNITWCLTASPDADLEDVDGWLLVAECEVELKPVDAEVKSRMAEALDEKIEEVKTEMLAKVELLEQEKKELLAIEYTP